MKPVAREDVLPALLRPGLYAGEQRDRSMDEWKADAVASYVNHRTGCVQMRPDDLSLDPALWSGPKLRKEYANGRGFLAVIAEYERRWPRGD